jgi:endonuclease/exonuclease/phosphatase family metal-dependent hydrolase
LGGDFNAPKRERADGSIIPHGENKSQYTDYPDYGDPHYVRESDGDMTELEFKQRRQLAEARIFDSDAGDWGLEDVYWAADESLKKASVEDYTHVIPNGTPARKRLDHVFTSQQFEIKKCEIYNGEFDSPDALRASDHASVMTSLQIK